MTIQTYPNRAAATAAQCAFHARRPEFVWGIGRTPGAPTTWAVYVRNPGDSYSRRIYCTLDTSRDPAFT